MAKLHAPGRQPAQCQFAAPPLQIIKRDNGAVRLISLERQPQRRSARIRISMARFSFSILWTRGLKASAPSAPLPCRRAMGRDLLHQARAEPTPRARTSASGGPGGISAIARSKACSAFYGWPARFSASPSHFLSGLGSKPHARSIARRSAAISSAVRPWR